MNADILPTAKQLQTFSNKHDDQCFDCNQLWEDKNHVLRYPSNNQCQACTNASQILWQHFQKQHTPNVMAELLRTSMDHWINHHCIELPQWQLTNKLILLTLTKAFNSQKQIGWDQFFCG